MTKVKSAFADPANPWLLVVFESAIREGLQLHSKI
jgi:hypothetical protein